MNESKRITHKAVRLMLMVYNVNSKHYNITAMSYSKHTVRRGSKATVDRPTKTVAIVRVGVQEPHSSSLFIQLTRPSTTSATNISLLWSYRVNTGSGPKKTN